MKKIYIAHSKEIDYLNQLYIPLRNADFLKDYLLILPHEKDANSSNTRDFYKGIDIFIAEVSKPGIGLGIEIGWIYDENKPIYCIYKSGTKASKSIYTVTNNIYEYNDTNEMLDIIKEIIQK